MVSSDFSNQTYKSNILSGIYGIAVAFISPNSKLLANFLNNNLLTVGILVKVKSLNWSVFQTIYLNLQYKWNRDKGNCIEEWQYKDIGGHNRYIGIDLLTLCFESIDNIDLSIQSCKCSYSRYGKLLQGDKLSNNINL